MPARPLKPNLSAPYAPFLTPVSTLASALAACRGCLPAVLDRPFCRFLGSPQSGPSGRPTSTHPPWRQCIATLYPAAPSLPRLRVADALPAGGCHVPTLQCSAIAPLQIAGILSSGAPVLPNPLTLRAMVRRW